MHPLVQAVIEGIDPAPKPDKPIEFFTTDEQQLAERWDLEMATEAAISSLNAVCQLLDVSRLVLKGTSVSNSTFVHLLYQVDKTLIELSSYSYAISLVKNGPPFAVSRSFDLGQSVRRTWMKAILSWIESGNAPSANWSSLWNLYRGEHGHSLLPNWLGLTTDVEALEHDGTVLQGTAIIGTPGEYQMHLWHSEAAIPVCESLAILDGDIGTTLMHELLLARRTFGFEKSPDDEAWFSQVSYDPACNQWTWGSEVFAPFSPRAQKSVEAIWTATKKGKGLSLREIREAADIVATETRDIFKIKNSNYHPAWKRMIVRKENSYWIAKPAQ